MFHCDSFREKGRKKCFIFVRKRGLDFSRSPEHDFTSGAIYCLKAEIFWASPHSKSSTVLVDGVAARLHRLQRHLLNMWRRSELRYLVLILLLSICFIRILFPFPLLLVYFLPKIGRDDNWNWSRDQILVKFTKNWSCD